MRVAEIGEIWRGDMKKKGKDLPGELTASWPSEIHWWGGSGIFQGVSRAPLGPEGHRTCKGQCRAHLEVHRVDGGMLRTPEFKVKALWNWPTPKLDPSLLQSSAEPRAGGGLGIVLAQCRKAGYQNRRDNRLLCVYL